MSMYVHLRMSSICLCMSMSCNVYVYRLISDARERERLERHAALREACSAGDAARVRQLVKQLGRDAATVINMTPDAQTTLLYK